MVPPDDTARGSSSADASAPQCPSAGGAAEPLVSEFAGDDEMAELIEFFIEDLRQRVETIAAAWSDGDRERIRTIAHQLKGAAAGYGYPTITHAAGAVERLLEEQESELASVAEKVEDLLTLCRRAAQTST